MNEKNLRPPFSPSEAREFGKKGAAASAKTRRQRKTLKDELLYLLGRKYVGEDGKKHTAQHAISAALIQKAVCGDPKAFELIRDTIGEKPTENVTLSVPDFSALDAAFAALGGEDK